MTKLVIAALAGMGALIFMLVHPVGPLLVLLMISPVDSIFFQAFGTIGNAVTYVPITVLLMRLSPIQWPQVLFGTRIQTVIIVLMLALVLSHIVALPYHGPTIGFEYARKFTLVFLTALFAWSLRDPRYIMTIVRVMVIAMTVYTSLSMLGYFAGINIIPTYHRQSAVEYGSIAGEEFEKYKTKDWRFSGANLPVNRYGNWMLLPTILAMGWAGSRTATRRSRMVALGCLGILLTGILATLSRNAFGTTTVSVALILVLVYRLRPLQVFGFAAVGAVLVGVIWYVATTFSIDQAFQTRFDPEDISSSAYGRLVRVFTGFKLFASSPLWGVGDAMFKVKNVYQTQGQNAHNAYMSILAETGLIGFLPWMTLLFMVFQRLRRPHPHLPEEFERWRPYFLTGFIALCMSMATAGYEYERWLWFTFAYAAALERASAEMKREQDLPALDDSYAPDSAAGSGDNLDWVAHSGLPGRSPPS